MNGGEQRNEDSYMRDNFFFFLCLRFEGKGVRQPVSTNSGIYGTLDGYWAVVGEGCVCGEEGHTEWSVGRIEEGESHGLGKGWERVNTG